MKIQSYKLEGQAKANAVLTSSNSAGMSKFSHMTVTMNAIQVQLNKFSLTTTNPTRTKRKRAKTKNLITRSDWTKAKRGANDG